LQIDEDMAPGEQAQSSNDEDIRSAHTPKVNLQQDWWKPLEEERHATPEPAWSISSSDVPTDDIAMFIDWFCKRRGITELKHQDLEGPTFEIVKVFHPDVIHLQYQMQECHKLLTDSVDNSILRHNVSKPLPLGGPPGQVTIQSDFFFNKDLEYLRYGSKEECKYDIAAMYGTLTGGSKDNNSTLIDTHLKLGIESYQTQLNLTKPRWDATSFEYKHDYTVIDSLRAVKFQDRYWVQMIMRFNEIHKFSDGMLQQIDEALDYRVKEFRINRMNPGLNTRFWTRKDVDRSKDFMFAIQKWLKTRRIFRNLESFVGGQIRDGDYRLLKRTE
nr:hypothetical protein [Tanacetum cinerariifolium]